VFVGFFVLVNPMTLDAKYLTLLIQGVCVFIVTALLALSEINTNELTAANVASQVGKWLVIFLPISLLGLQYNYNTLFQYFNIILFAINFIVWVIFSSSYSIDIKSKRNLDYSDSAVVFTSIWLLIGIIKFVGDNRFFQFATEPLNQFHSIHYLLNLKSVFIGAFGVYCIIYVISNIGGEDNPSIPKIPSSSVDTSDLTNYNWVNAVFFGLEYSLNILISVINPPIQIIGTVLVYFLCLIPKLILRLILRLGKLSILILPSIGILLILLFLVYLVRENAVEIVSYVQTTSIVAGKSLIIPLTIYGVLSVLGIITIQLVNHFSFDTKSDFTLNLLPFSLTYFLLLLTIAGWAVYGIGKIKIAGLQFGYYTITMSALLIIGIIVLVLLQINSSESKSTK
jgi:hypothetical protein